MKVKKIVLPLMIYQNIKLLQQDLSMSAVLSKPVKLY